MGQPDAAEQAATEILEQLARAREMGFRTVSPEARQYVVARALLESRRMAEARVEELLGWVQNLRENMAATEIPAGLPPAERLAYEEVQKYATVSLSILYDFVRAQWMGDRKAVQFFLDSARRAGGRT